METQLEKLRDLNDAFINDLRENKLDISSKEFKIRKKEQNDAYREVVNLLKVAILANPADRLLRLELERVKASTMLVRAFIKVMDMERINEQNRIKGNGKRKSR